MKNVRLIFKKGGPLRFVSHLDMNRVMTRLLRLSSIPIWYTEGFNRRPYLTFALPLSLGFYSEWEVMDFRFDDDDFPLDKAEAMLRAVCPEGIEVITLCEPTHKSGKIAMADFKVEFSADSKATADSLTEFLSRDKLLVQKTTKKGGTKEIDLAQKLISFSVEQPLCLTLRLPAGGEDNVNPKLFLDKYLGELANGGFYTVTRTALLLADGTRFE